MTSPKCYKNKMWCYTFLFLLLLSSVTGAVKVQLSTDNETFWDIEGVGGSSVDLNSSFAFVDNLNPSTQYYYRAKNDSTQWNYGSFYTKSDREILPTIIGLAIIGLFFLWMGITSNGWATKILFYGLLLIQIMNIALAIYLRETGTLIVGVLKTNFDTLLLISFGMAMIGLIFLAIKLITPETPIANEDDFRGEEKWMGVGKWQEK